jgi:hypothetical protein
MDYLLNSMPFWRRITQNHDFEKLMTRPHQHDSSETSGLVTILLVLVSSTPHGHPTFIKHPLTPCPGQGTSAREGTVTVPTCQDYKGGGSDHEPL